MTALARFAALADDPVALVQQCEAYRLCLAASDEINDAVRDDLVDARREAAIYRLMFGVAMEALHAALTLPKHYARMQDELSRERAEFVTQSLAADQLAREAFGRTPADDAGEELRDEP